MAGQGQSQSDEFAFKAAMAKVTAVCESLTDMQTRLANAEAEVCSQSSGSWLTGFRNACRRTGGKLASLNADAQAILDKLNASVKIHHQTVALTQEKQNNMYNKLNF